MLELNTDRILFMASPDFALPSLIACHEYVGVTSVITRPDAPKGRGQTLEPTPIKAWAEQKKIPCFEPKNKQEIETLITHLNPSLIIVIAYGVIIPKSITDSYMCINCHGSILPQYRGASPIHSSLFNGDSETGITVIHMNEKMDEGDCLYIKKIPITPTDNLQTLHDKLSQLCAETVVDVLKKKQVDPVPQDHSQATYCQKLTTEDREIKPEDPLKTKLGKIRAFSPKPGAFIIAKGKQIKILEAIQDGPNLLPTCVQPEGKKPMSYHDYKLGNPEGLSLC